MNINANFQYSSLVCSVVDLIFFSSVKLTAPLMLAMVLAIGATVVSLGIAIYAGWHSGGFFIEKSLRIALIGVVVLFVHLLPMASPALRGHFKFTSCALWLVATAVVLHGQVTFLIISQRHAGDLRAAAVQAPSLPIMSNFHSGRSRTEIAKEKTKVIADLARAQVQRCLGDCAALNVRRARLTAEIVELDAEADEVKRREIIDDRRNSQADRLDEMRASLRADPVASSVATWIGVTEQRLEIVIGLAYAVVLEGAAVLGWVMVSVAWGRAASRNIVASDTTLEVPENDPAEETDSSRAVISDDDKLVERVRVAVAAGELKPTQYSIRKFLGCGQPKAGMVNRRYIALYGAMNG